MIDYGVVELIDKFPIIQEFMNEVVKNHEDPLPRFALGDFLIDTNLDSCVQDGNFLQKSEENIFRWDFVGEYLQRDERSYYSQHKIRFCNLGGNKGNFTKLISDLNQNSWRRSPCNQYLSTAETMVYLSGYKANELSFTRKGVYIFLEYYKISEKRVIRQTASDLLKELILLCLVK